MSDVVTEKFSCGSCARTYAWKPQLAGKKVKCKCGQPIAVPEALKPENTDIAADDGFGDFDLDSLAKADARAVERTANNAADMNIIPMAAAVAAPSRGTVNPMLAQPVGYQSGQTARQQQRAAELRGHMVDWVRDVYVPASMAVIGFILFVSCYMTMYHFSAVGLGVVCTGITLMTIVKTIGLIVFAFVVAGPLGVSFGTLQTAVLKLAAIAIFCDGVTSWVFSMAGRGHAGANIYLLTLPASGIIYWGAMAYLFSMEVLEARSVVVVLTIFDRLLRYGVIILIAALLGVGAFAGASSSAAASATAKFGAATARPKHSIYTAQIVMAKEQGRFKEAEAYIADGHQAFLKDMVDQMYAAGAKDIGFEVSRDINGKGGPIEMFIEMPDSPTARQKIVDLRKASYESVNMALFTGEDTDHPDNDWINYRLR